MKKLVVLLLAALMATTAFAALDPDADSFGVYFDTLGNTNTGPAITGTTRNVYVLLMNPTTAVKGFEFGYELVPTGTMDDQIDGFFSDDLVRLSSVVGGSSFVDVGVSTDPIQGSHVVGYAVARPIVPAMLMVTWRFRYFGIEDTGIQFFLRNAAVSSPGANGYPIIDGGPGLGLRQAGIASGDRLLPCATTVLAAPVAVESESFGAVKALFR